jgi:hypothetical protein
MSDDTNESRFKIIQNLNGTDITLDIIITFLLFIVLPLLKSNMAARVHNVFSLAEILKIFLSETTKSIEL